jgi:hypothetical protein
MSTIGYDKPVKDFIAGLDDTGHVTHESFTKKSVTLHHNGGNLTLEGILSVWKTRRASAHFQVDSRGAVGQYVRVKEYAWATGSTLGNEESISIEMADASFAPNWEVSETTWKAAARLAAWLFFHEIGQRPSSSNLHPHRHWSATDCPGPWVVRNFNKILVECQTQYDNFKAGNPDHSHPEPPKHKSVVEIAHEVIAGKWGNGPDRVHKLLVAGYDPNAVQVEVNRIERGVNRKKDPHMVIAEVIAGKWGNGQERIDRLTKAGFDPAAVQRLVNERFH